jgi:gamma-tubulin complex component 2
MEGYGFGGENESLFLKHRNTLSQPTGNPILYGETVMVQSAKILRFLLPSRDDCTEPNFDVDAVTTADWFVQPAELGISLNRSILRSGDRILLKSSISKEFLMSTAYEKLGTTRDVPNERMVWQVMVASVPVLPFWTTHRPFLVGHFLKDSRLLARDKVEDGLHVELLPLPAQEQLIIEDLLSVFLGFEGKYITAHSTSQGLDYELDAANIDVSLAQVAKRVLPIGRAFVVVRGFLSYAVRYELGLVSHGLAAGLKVLLKEYMLLVAQLEHQHRLESLTLQKVWLFVQPALHSMGVLQEVCLKARGLSGGELLNALKAISDLGGDERRAEILQFLLARAAVAYLDDCHIVYVLEQLI